MLAMNFKDKCDSVRILATVSVGALAMATVPAMAQDATAAPQQPAASQTKYDGDAIVVTGITKQDANIQDTPIAITAFSGETLTEQGIGKVDEIATFTPGFNIRGAGNNPTALTPAMRRSEEIGNASAQERGCQS